MSADRVMMLIDADNVSVDVMEQGLRMLMNQHGGVHVRRAYCTAESALKHQAFFKRMGIKPMVNLAAGKNSTDIALAVDAIDLVLAERPDVVVIASSDSDFAPLVQRLREKGCVVRGIGQAGKTGQETQDAYDDYTVLEHRRSESSAEQHGRGARPARKTAVARKTPATKKAAPARKTARAGRQELAAPVSAPAPELQAAPAPVPVPAPAPVPVPAPVEPAPVAAETTADTRPVAVPEASADAAPASESPAPAKKAAARKTTAARKTPAAKKTTRRTAAAVAESEAAAALPAPTPAPEPVPEHVQVMPPVPAPAPVPAPTPSARPSNGRGRSDEGRGGKSAQGGGGGGGGAGGGNGGGRGGMTLQTILDCLPELQSGARLPLNVAAQRLREAQLLSKSGSSLKLFAQFPDRFELQPAGKPSQVRLRA